MEREEITLGRPVTVAGVTIIPVIKTLWHSWHGQARILFSANGQPIDIIVISAVGKSAFRTDGQEISLEQLAQEIPAVGELLI